MRRLLLRLLAAIALPTAAIADYGKVSQSLFLGTSLKTNGGLERK